MTDPLVGDVADLVLESAVKEAVYMIRRGSHASARLALQDGIRVADRLLAS